MSTPSLGWPGVIGPRQVKTVVVALCVLAAVAGVSGVTAEAIFRQASTLKWGIGFLAPLGLLVVVNSDQPLRLMVGAAIFVAPFGALRATVAGVAIPFFAVILIVAIATAVLCGPAPRRPGPLGYAALAGSVLLIVPLALGNSIFGHLVVLGAAGATAWLTTAVAREPGGLRFVMRAVVVSALVQAAIALWELHTKHQINFYGSAGTSVFGSNYFFGYESTFRPVGSFYDPISLGNVLGVALPVGVGLASIETARTWKLLTAVCIAASGAGLLFTLSRMSWIGGAAGMLVTLALLPRRNQISAAAVILPLVVVVALVISGLGGRSFSDRFDSIFSPRSSTYSTAAGDQQRVSDWGAVLGIAGSHPLTGVGFGRMTEALDTKLPSVTAFGQAQSTYLQFLGEGGILGAGALVLLLGAQARVLREGRRDPRNRIVVAALTGATAALMIEWTTDVTVRYAPVAASVAVIFGAAAALRPPGRIGLRIHSRASETVEPSLA